MSNNPSASIFSFSLMKFSIFENEEIGRVTLVSMYLKMNIPGIKKNIIITSVMISNGIKEMYIFKSLIDSINL